MWLRTPHFVLLNASFNADVLKILIAGLPLQVLAFVKQQRRGLEGLQLRLILVLTAPCTAGIFVRCCCRCWPA